MKVSLSKKEFNELLLSHHPNCKCFKDDVFIIFGRRICNGCLIAYPIAILILLLFKPSGIESVILSALFVFISQIRRLTKEPKIKLFMKALAGIGLGFGLGSMWWALNAQEWLIVVLLIIGALIYLFIRLHFLQQKLIRCNCRNLEN